MQVASGMIHVPQVDAELPGTPSCAHDLGGTHRGPQHPLSLALCSPNNPFLVLLNSGRNVRVFESVYVEFLGPTGKLSY